MNTNTTYLLNKKKNINKVSRSNSYNALKPKPKIIRTNSDNNILYSNKYKNVESYNEKNIKNNEKNIKNNEKNIKNNEKNIKNNEKNIKNNLSKEELKELTNDCILLTKKQKESIREYDYIKYINLNGKLISGYVNKIFYYKDKSEIAWVMSKYIAEKPATWIIYPNNTNKIWKKIYPYIEYEILTKEIEKYKITIAVMNRYLESKFKHDYINFINKNLEIELKKINTSL